MTQDLDPPHAGRRWLVFALVSAAFFGDLYCYDSIGPVADLLQQQRHFSDTQIATLNAIYSLPNIVLVVVGGLLVDRFGASRMLLITCVICSAGAALTALSPSFVGMAGGRLLFGIGAETLNIAVLTAVGRYFARGNLAFPMALCIAAGRLGSFSADMSPNWLASAYAGGWQPPLLIALYISLGSVLASLGYAWLDRSPGPSGGKVVRIASPPVLGSFRFRKAYWYLLVLTILWYAVILAFRSTFAIKYFQHSHGLDLATAGAMNSYVFLAALFASPMFGWICGRSGRYAPFLTFGALLLPLSLALMAWTQASLWIGTVLIGISYSLVPAVLWPFCRALVPANRFGLAMGLIATTQNAGIAGANLIAGTLNDHFAAGAQNPAGYQPMMLFFCLTSLAGAVFAALLWGVVGGGRHQPDEQVAAIP
ncbi:MAG: MFS transporter [Proteobacteria bacterium]|nr:MFS transporter [Pseudomonadota bacterium]